VITGRQLCLVTRDVRFHNDCMVVRAYRVVVRNHTLEADCQMTVIVGGLFDRISTW
jgi:hypothetical protein